MRYNKPRRNRFRSNDKGFRRNGSHDLRTNSVNSALNSHQRRSFTRNGYRPEQLLEKYNNLAKEALSSGDKILSENYYQHADHFLRVIENKNSNQHSSKPYLDNSSTNKNSNDKIILEDKKDPISNSSQNSEEIKN